MIFDEYANSPQIVSQNVAFDTYIK